MFLEYIYKKMRKKLDLSSRFWEETLSFSARDHAGDLKEFKASIRVCRMKIRKMMILSERYFLDKEKIALQLLRTSNFPANDISNILDLCHPEAYRLISYVKVLIREYYTYFESKSYKRLQPYLCQVLPQNQYVALHLYAVHRSTRNTAHAMGYSVVYMQRLIAKLDKNLKTYSIYDKDIRDLFIAWRRIRKVKKSAFSWYEKFLKKDYISHEGRIVQSIRKNWVTQREKLQQRDLMNNYYQDSIDECD